MASLGDFKEAIVKTHEQLQAKEQELSRLRSNLETAKAEAQYADQTIKQQVHDSTH